MTEMPDKFSFSDPGGSPGDEHQLDDVHTTRIVITHERRPEPPAHFLVPVDSPERSVRVGQEPLAIGRSPESQLALDDLSVSWQHCRVQLRNGELWIDDLGSTNGTFVDGRRIVRPTLVPVGSMLQIGQLQIRHELRHEQAVTEDGEWSSELKAASGYITNLLPEPWLARRIKIHWRFVPCRRLGGDSLGYSALDDDRTAIYLIDVCGHGLRAALHSVSILNVLRQRSLPEDYSDPGAILTRLNRTFPMEAHGGMYFTIWYGVFDVARRRLRFSCGGHPPAIVRAGEPASLQRLWMRRPPIGTFERVVYESEEVEIPPDSFLYVFSDGVFEEWGPRGQMLGLPWLESVLLKQREDLQQEPMRIESALRRETGELRFQDDFTLLVAHL
jgi:serine phosphatase RsbU (regulator of sigma subunit)